MGTSFTRFLFLFRWRGSSPRVWGQVISFVTAYGGRRIIPTRMGTRTYDGVKYRPIRDHPHAYGDKCRLGGKYRDERGSSPRVWGQVRIVNIVHTIAGIIPTRMGTSSHRQHRPYHRRDHPHAYGDKVFTSPLCVSLRGSSPRVWGQERLNELFKGDEKDHPHAYGDK